MIEQFEKLPACKQNKILDACFREFGQKGYQRASTNTIVNQAGIPKGTLFYFFGNKKQLFLYLVDYAVGKYVKFVDRFMDDLPPDLFDRLLFMVQVRMRFAALAPQLYRFLFKALLNIPDSIQADMQDRFKVYAEGNQKFMREGLDTSRLRADVSVEQVMELLSYIMDGLLTRHTDKFTGMDAGQSLKYVEGLLEQSQRYFEFVKRGVYTEKVVGIS